MEKIKLYLILFVIIFCWPLISFAGQYDLVMETKSYDVKVLFKTNVIKGILYKPVPDQSKPLIVAVHGTTYGKWMWDVPGCSWVDYFTKELGYPVLAIDRLGGGDSSKPNGDLLTPCYELKALKDFLSQVKEENINRKIIWAGHSMGCLFGNLIAADSDLIDGLINLGWMHSKMGIAGPPVTEFLTNNYIEWTPEQRRDAFYYLAGADLGVIKYDNSNSYAMSRGSGLGSLGLDKFVIPNIEKPVFLSIGEYDGLWENPDLNLESQLYENAVVTTFLQEDAGHVNLLHLSYLSLLDSIGDWLEVSF